MKIFFLAVLVIVLVLLAGAYIAFFYGAVRVPKDDDPRKNKWIKDHADKVIAGVEWFRAQQPERIEISSFDGLKLVGWFLPHEKARGTILLIHGYRSTPLNDFGVVYPYLYSLGFNIFAATLRSHGESEGKYITFGIKERFDVRDWATYLFDRFGPEHRVILDGISMGCTCSLMSLGVGLPENVCGVIADCGFTSPYDQFVHMFRKRFHLPCHPLMDIAEWYAKAFADFKFKDYSTITALENSNLPVLFIHGESDSFVPPRFTDQNYAACRSEKKLLTFPGAGHGGSYLSDQPRYQAAVEEFLNSLVP